MPVVKRLAFLSYAALRGTYFFILKAKKTNVRQEFSEP